MVRIRILVVEDELIVGLALREDLQESGALVTVKVDAESALQELSESTFDAAIIDVALPGMRGDALAKQCRRRFPRMPIVLATGFDEREIRSRLDADPMCEVLEKPHDFQQVRASLERLGLVFPQQPSTSPKAEVV